MGIPTSINDLSSVAASNSPQGSDQFGPGADDYFRAIQAILKQTYLQAGSWGIERFGGTNDGVTDNTPFLPAAITGSLNKPFLIPANTAINLTVGTDVSTLALGLIAVQQWVIPGNSTLNFIIPTGAISLSSPIVINHPFGSRINLTGATIVSTTATTAGTVTGSSGSWSVPLTVASATGIAVGDWTLIKSVTGTGRFKQFSGMCKISGVSGTTVTVTNTSRMTSWPTSTLTAANIAIIKSSLSFTGCDGIQINANLGKITNLAIVGNSTAGTSGLITNKMSTANSQTGNVYIDGSNSGISTFGDSCICAQYGGVIDAPGLCVSNGIIYNAVVQYGGQLYLNGGISQGGQTIAGVSANNSGALYFDGGISCGHLMQGIFATGSGSITANNAFSWANVVANVCASYGGTIKGDALNSQYCLSDGMKSLIGGNISGASMVSNNNGGNGFYALMGNLYCVSSTGTGNTGFGYYCDAGVMDATGSTGSGNTTYQYIVTDKGILKAVNAVATGTVYSVLGGVLDVTGMTGTHTLSYGQSGNIINGATQTSNVSSLNVPLAYADGGTNVNSFSALRASFAPWTVAEGGTDATTAADARTNLGVFNLYAAIDVDGTSAAINHSLNTASFTRNSTGDYTWILTNGTTTIYPFVSAITGNNVGTVRLVSNNNNAYNFQVFLNGSIGDPGRLVIGLIDY